MNLRARNTLVRIKRRDHLDHVDGCVIDVGRGFVLLAVYDHDTVIVDSFSAVRRSDVKTVTKRRHRGFVKHALAARGQWPPPDRPVTVDLEDVTALLRGLRDAPIVQIHTERTHPGVFYVGRIVKVGRRNLSLHDIGPSGRWARGVTKFPLAEITRIDVGNLYSYALLQVNPSADTLAVPVVRH